MPIYRKHYDTEAFCWAGDMEALKVFMRGEGVPIAGVELYVLIQFRLEPGREIDFWKPQITCLCIPPGWFISRNGPFCYQLLHPSNFTDCEIV